MAHGAHGIHHGEHSRHEVDDGGNCYSHKDGVSHGLPHGAHVGNHGEHSRYEIDDGRNGDSQMDCGIDMDHVRVCMLDGHGHMI